MNFACLRLSSMNSFPLKKKAPLFALVFCIYNGMAQVGTRHGVNILDGKPVPTDHVRDDDVVWMKTVWQEIDLREKINHPLYFPERADQNRKSLFDYIKQSVLLESGLAAYSVGALGDDDMFTEALSKQALDSMFYREELRKTQDVLSDTMIEVKIVTALGSESIVGYEIKEHWFIDKERSSMCVKILGICPLVAIYDEEGNFRGKKRLFWIYYPDAKYSMANWPYYNRSSDLQNLSYSDLFEQRRFSSHIVKTSNVYNRTINEYLLPLDALLAGYQEKELLRNLEMDMWEY